MFVCLKLALQAPEVLQLDSHGGGGVRQPKKYTNKADMWSLGCVLYSLLCGSPAFHGNNTEELEDSILRGDVNLHGRRWRLISAEAKDLVSRLLQTNSRKRISAKDALQHDW